MICAVYVDKVVRLVVKEGCLLPYRWGGQGAKNHWWCFSFLGRSFLLVCENDKQMKHQKQPGKEPDVYEISGCLPRWFNCVILALIRSQSRLELFLDLVWLDNSRPRCKIVFQMKFWSWFDQFSGTAPLKGCRPFEQKKNKNKMKMK